MQIYNSQCFRGDSLVMEGVSSVSCLSSVLKVSKGLTLGLLIFFSFPAIASAALTDGLVGYCTFDGKDTNWATSKTNDLSGNGNTGTMTSMSTTTSPVVGKIGQGLKFDGVDDYVNVVDSASLDVGNAFTLSAWIKVNVLGSESIISKDYTVSPDTIPYVIGFGLNDGVDNSLQFGFYDGTSWRLVKQIGTFPTSVWKHVVGTWDGTTARLYIDSSQNNSATPGGTAPNDNDPIYIGRRHDAFYTDEFFNGSLDDVRS